MFFSDIHSRLGKVLRVFRFRSVLVKILGILLVLLLAVGGTVGMILNDGYRESATENAIGSSFSMMNHGGNRLDSVLSELSIKAGEILDLPTVGNALISKNVLTNPSILEVTSRFYNLAKENPVTEQISLFIPGERTVLTSDQTAETYEAFGADQLSDFFEKNLKDTEEKNIFCFDGSFYIAAAFPRGKATAFLAIRLNTDELYKIWREIKNDASDSLSAYVYVNDMPLFSKQEKYPDADELLVTERTERSPSDILCRTADSNRLLLSHTSLAWGLRTVGMLNTEIRQEGLFSNHISLWLLLGVLWLGAGILLVLIVYPPLLRLLNASVSHPEGVSEIAGNEYDVIEQFFAEQKNRERKLSSLLRDSGEAVIQSLFSGLLRGEPVDRETVEMVFSETQFGFAQNALFGLILVDFCGKDGQPAQERERMEGELICARFLNCYFKDKCAVCVLGQNTRVLAVLGFSKDERPETVNGYLTECEKQLYAETQKGPVIPVIAFCQPKGNIYELPETLETIKTILQEKMYYGRSRNAENIPEAETLLQQALEYVLRSPEDGKKHLLELIGSFDVSPQAMPLYRMTVDNLLAFFVRCRIPSEGRWNRMREIVEKCRTKAELEPEKEELMLFFGEASERIAQAATRVQIQYLETAKNYIRGHFSDSLLSLGEVSDSCGIGGSYLSHLFTTYSGQNFTDYLNAYRIRRACEMLDGTSLSIAEIGFKAGFNSPQNFNRVFKKHMDSTPTRYRSDRMKEKEGTT